MRTLLVIAFATVAAPASADVQLWNEAGVRSELAKRVAVSFDQHLRFDQDASRVESIMPEAGVHYRFAKWLRAGVGYRLEYERDGEDMVVRHRGHVYTRVRRDLGPLRLGYKLQFQESYRPDKNTELKHVIRNHLGASLRSFKRIEPAAGAELFHRLGDGDTARVEKLWLTIGATYSRKRWDGDLFYRIELPADEMEPTLHIIGLAFHGDVSR